MAERTCAYRGPVPVPASEEAERGDDEDEGAETQYHSAEG